MGWKDYLPGGSSDPFVSGAAKVFGSGAAQAFAPSNIYKSAKTAFDDPKATLRYLDDSRKNLNFDLKEGIGFQNKDGTRVGDWFSGNVPMLIAGDLARGQAQADAANPDYGTLSDQDLYRMRSEQTAARDNPFTAQNYNDDFMNAYTARNSPRVYSTDNSFVYPDTLPVSPNTALIPATAQPAVVGGGSPNAPLATGPVFAPEVTASTATPGYSGVVPDKDTVAAQFRLPTAQQQQKRSTSQVR